MPLPGDLLALLNACRADPVSDLPRLVLADWLDEHDDPARAELLRVQCELARPSLDTERIAELKARERALIAANWRAWAGGLHAVCCDLIDADAHQRYGADAAELRRRRRASQNVPPPTVARDDPFLQGLPWKFTRGLIDLTTTPGEIGSLRAWSNGDELPWLDSLRMPLGRWLSSLVDSPWVLPRRLEPFVSLGLTLRGPCADLTEEGNPQYGRPTLALIDTAIRSRHWRRVRRVALEGQGYEGDIDFHAAIRRADYDRVGHLEMDSAVFAESLAAKRLPKLVSLDVGGLDLPPETLLALAKRTPRLNVLSAYRTPLGDRGFAALLATSWGETLHTLEVMNCDLGDDAMTTLVRSGLLGRLYGPQLNLSMNRIEDAGLATLAGSDDLPHFSELVLRENRVGDAGVEALAASPFAANLRYLDLWKNRLTDRAALALAASPHLGQLRDLNVRDNALTDAGRAALTARYGAAAKVGF